MLLGLVPLYKTSVFTVLTYNTAWACNQCRWDKSVIHLSWYTKYQVSRYVCSAASVPVSLIHLKCIGMTNHWYITTDTSTARKHVKLYFSSFSLQFPVLCAYLTSKCQFPWMRLCCCLNVFQILCNFLWTVWVFTIRWVLHFVLMRNISKVSVIQFCIFISITILSCKCIRHQYQGTFSEII